MNESLYEFLEGSRASEIAVYLLGNIPGLPPISQALHILGIAIVMGSVVTIHLRLLGLAAPSQKITEMIERLMPWMWCALTLNLVTGLLFVIARPGRYFFNPVFGIKFALLVPAVTLALILHLLGRREFEYWESSRRRMISARVIAVVSLTVWVGVVFAGRWIAYSDYLFFYE